MNEFLTSSAYFAVMLCIVSYTVGLWIEKRLKTPLANPLLISAAISIGVLLLFNISYESFNEGAKYLNFLLTPVTVCLALPLYEKMQLLIKYKAAVFLGILSGVVSCLTVIVLLSLLFGLSEKELISLLPKSITTPMALGIEEKLGGLSSITMPAIVISGVTGNMFAVFFFKIFRITEPVSQGLACGCASHAIGTARAAEIGDIQGAMSGLAIAVAGIMTVIIVPFAAKVYALII